MNEKNKNRELDDELIARYVDGLCSPEEKKHVDSILKTDAEAREMMELQIHVAQTQSQGELEPVPEYVT
ncbi:MAG: hypothetical protein K8I00_02065, partial [Candidatus Omnitrophica bacterium]|nr:hypothetical protein [Candidatus Omnitrophota bacterium]